MIRRPESRWILAMVLLGLSACAGRGNGWPSLMTPEEQRTGKAANPAATPPIPPAPTVAPPPATAPAAAPAATDTATAALLRAQITRLAEARRDARYIDERWSKQRAALAKTQGSIKVKGPSDSNWNAAQLELTRLNQIAAEWDDLELLVSRLTGQLAIAAHGGGDVATSLADAGALLLEIEAAKAEAAKATAAARQQFSR